MPFNRHHPLVLDQRLTESPRYLIVVAEPRQIGKSTMVRRLLALRPQNTVAFESVDNPAPARDLRTFGDEFPSHQALPGAEPTADWLVLKWMQARAKARNLPDNVPYILAIDEVQKVPRWSEIVKGLWDADRAQQLNMHVVLLGSSPWLMQRGLTESLAGRYELIRMNHWS